MQNRTLIVLAIAMISQLVWAAPQAPKMKAGKKTTHRMSFEETISRYPSPTALITQMEKIIPTMTIQCRDLERSGKATVLGAIDPETGSAIDKEPGAFFVETFANCIRESLSNIESTMSTVILGATLRESLSQHWQDLCRTNQNWEKHECGKHSWDVLHIPTASLSPELDRRVMNRIVDYLLGPDEILQEQGYLGSPSVFGVDLPSRERLIEYLNQSFEDLLKSDTQELSQYYSNRSLLRKYLELAILLRLGPALRH